MASMSRRACRTNTATPRGSRFICSSASRRRICPPRMAGSREALAAGSHIGATKRNVMLSEAKHLAAIGIDVGGTKIAGGVVMLNTGEILARRSSPTEAARGGAAVLDDALALADELRARARELGVAVQ